MVAFFKKYLRLQPEKKMLEKLLFELGYFNDEIIINIKKSFLYGLKAF